MQGICSPRGALMGFTITLLLIFGFCFCFCFCFCYCSDKLVEVVGTGDCVDCTAMEVKGILVAISCKDANAKLKIRGVSQLDGEGKFRVILPSESVNDDGQLKEECFAQLHKASNAPCSADNGLEALKVILKSTDGGKHAFTPSGKLTFSQTACTPAFVFPKFRLQALLPPLPKFKKLVPTPIPKFKKPLPLPLPKSKKPLPPQIPKFKRPLQPPLPQLSLPPPSLMFKNSLLPTLPLQKFKIPIPRHVPKFRIPPIRTPFNLAPPPPQAKPVNTNS